MVRAYANSKLSELIRDVELFSSSQGIVNTHVWQATSSRYVADRPQSVLIGVCEVAGCRGCITFIVSRPSRLDP